MILGEEHFVPQARALCAGAATLLHDLKNELSVALGAAELALGLGDGSPVEPDLRRGMCALERVAADLMVCHELLVDGPPATEQLDLLMVLTGLQADLRPHFDAAGRSLRLAGAPDSTLAWAPREAVCDLCAALMFSAQSDLTVGVTAVSNPEQTTLQPAPYLQVVFEAEFPRRPTGRTFAVDVLVTRAWRGDLQRTPRGITLWCPRESGAGARDSSSAHEPAEQRE